MEKHNHVRPAMSAGVTGEPWTGRFSMQRYTTEPLWYMPFALPLALEETANTFAICSGMVLWEITKPGQSHVGIRLMCWGSCWKWWRGSCHGLEMRWGANDDRSAVVICDRSLQCFQATPTHKYLQYRKKTIVRPPVTHRNQCPPSLLHTPPINI